MSSRFIWKGALLDRLRELTADEKHFSCSQIAEIISRETNTPMTRNAIIGACHRNKIIITGSNKGGRRPGEQPKQPKKVRLWKPKPTEALMELETADVVSRDVSLMDLGPTDCRYPTGDSPFLFCGNPVQADSSYCHAHHALCWVKPNPPKPQTFRDMKRRAA